MKRMIKAMLIDADWRVYKDSVGAGNILDNGSLVTPEGVAVDVLPVGATHLGTVILQVDVLSGAGDYLAVDNLSFDQIPEPATLSVLAIGGGLALIGRRRR